MTDPGATALSNVAARRRTNTWPSLLLCVSLLALAGAAPARASLFGVFEDLAKAGSRAGEGAARRASGRAGRASTLAEHAALAATVLSTAGAAAYLTDGGGRILLFLAGSHGPVEFSGLAQAVATLPARLADHLGAGPLRTGARQAVVLDSSLAASFAPQADALSRDYRLSVSDPSYGVAPVVSFGPANARKFFVALKPGLAVSLRHAAITGQTRRLLSTVVRHEQVRVLAMFSHSDPDALARMLEVGRDRVVQFGADASGRAFSLAGFEDGVAVLVGHVEDGAFVLNPAGAGQAELRIGFAEIEAEAARANTTVLYVGCETFSDLTGTGFSQTVRDTEVMQGLKRALGADTYQDLLAGLGTPENPFVIDPASLAREAQRVELAAERLGQHAAKVDGGALSARLTASRSAGWAVMLPGALLIARNVYLMGLLPALLAARLGWRTYVRRFPSLPNRALHPAAHDLGSAAKLVLFALLLPLSAVSVLFLVLLGGGWSNREGMFDLFWSLFFDPIHFLASILCWSFLFIGRILVLFVTVFAVAPGVGTLSTIGASTGATAAVIAIVGAALLGGGAFCGYVFYRRAADWPDRILQHVIRRFDNRALRLAIIATPAATLAVAVALQ